MCLALKHLYCVKSCTVWICVTFSYISTLRPVQAIHLSRNLYSLRSTGNNYFKQGMWQHLSVCENICNSRSTKLQPTQGLNDKMNVLSAWTFAQMRVVAFVNGFIPADQNFLGSSTAWVFKFVPLVPLVKMWIKAMITEVCGTSVLLFPNSACSLSTSGLQCFPRFFSSKTPNFKDIFWYLQTWLDESSVIQGKSKTCRVGVPKDYMDRKHCRQKFTTDLGTSMAYSQNLEMFMWARCDTQVRNKGCLCNS